jgi:hypothetical protein
MIDAATWNRLLDEAHVTVARKWVLVIGEDHWSDSSDAEQAQVNRITDLDRLERMAQVAEKGASWQGILDTP